MSTLVPSFSSWTLSRPLPFAVVDPKVFQTGSHLHVLGSEVGSDSKCVVRTSKIDNGKNINAWGNSNSILEITHTEQSTATDKAVYVMGGYSGFNKTKKVFAGFFDEGGSITGWTEQPSMQSFQTNAACITHNNHVYALGGFINGSVTSKVSTCKILEDGNLSEWDAARLLPVKLWGGNVFITYNKFRQKYVLNVLGCTDHHKAYSQLYSAFINKDGTLTPWKKGNALPRTVSSTTLCVIDNHVYTFGGISNCHQTNSIYKAFISDNGELGVWDKAGVLPGKMSNNQVVLIKDSLYLVGGMYNNTPSRMVLTCNVTLKDTSVIPVKTKPVKVDLYLETRQPELFS